MDLYTHEKCVVAGVLGRTWKKYVVIAAGIKGRESFALQEVFETIVGYSAIRYGVVFSVSGFGGFNCGWGNCYGRKPVFYTGTSR